MMSNFFTTVIKLEINYKKKSQKKQNMESKQHATKKPQSQRRNQRGKQRLT